MEDAQKKFEDNLKAYKTAKIASLINSIKVLESRIESIKKEISEVDAVTFLPEGYSYYQN